MFTYWIRNEHILTENISHIYSFVRASVYLFFFLSGSTCSSFLQARWSILSKTTAQDQRMLRPIFRFCSTWPKIENHFIEFQILFPMCATLLWKACMKLSVVEIGRNLKKKADCHCSGMYSAFDFYGHDFTLIQIICDLENETSAWCNRVWYRTKKWHSNQFEE